MIRRYEECSTVIKEHMRDGDGQVLQRNLAEKEELLGKARLFGTLTLEPGCSIGGHQHNGENEYFYVLKGSPVYYDDDEEVQLHEGDVAICEDGHCHSIKNGTDETVVVLACIILK